MGAGFYPVAFLSECSSTISSICMARIVACCPLPTPRRVKQVVVLQRQVPSPFFGTVRAIRLKPGSPHPPREVGWCVGICLRAPLSRHNGVTSPISRLFLRWISELYFALEAASDGGLRLVP